MVEEGVGFRGVKGRVAVRRDDAVKGPIRTYGRANGPPPQSGTRSGSSQHFAALPHKLISPYLMGGGPPAELSNYDDISTRSEDSMVEIVRSTPQQPDTADRYVLLYSKSKVYVHPTAFSRDNIPGFVAIVKKVSLVVFGAWAISPSDLKPCNP